MVMLAVLMAFLRWGGSGGLLYGAALALYGRSRENGDGM